MKAEITNLYSVRLFQPTKIYVILKTNELAALKRLECYLVGEGLGFNFNLSYEYQIQAVVASAYHIVELFESLKVKYCGSYQMPNVG